MTMLAVLVTSMIAMPPMVSGTALSPDDASIVGSMQIWLDASDSSTLFQDAAGTISAGNGDPVGLWKDKSVNSRHVSQATAANRPTYATSGFRVQNQASVAFTKTPGVVDSGTCLRAATASDWNFLHHGSDFTMFVVMERTDTTAELNNFLSTNGSSSLPGIVLQADNRAAGATSNPAAIRAAIDPYSWPIQTVTPDNSALVGVPHLITWRLDVDNPGDDSTVIIDGTAFTSDKMSKDYSIADASYPLQLSSPSAINGLTGNIAEVIIYGAALSDTQIAGVNEYFHNKYGMFDADTEAIRTMFARIDLDYPGLQNVKAALNRDDLPAAEEAYLTFWRERQDRKVLWNPSGRFSSLENRTASASDFFRVHPEMISWRDREKLKGQIHTDCAWADFGVPTRWTLLTMADLMLENRLVHLREGNAPPREMGSPWKITGDHEWRHYFMPVLAQAYWLTGDDKYVSKLLEVWKTWIHNHAAGFSKTQWHARAFYAMQQAEHQTPVIEMVLESPALTPRDFCLIIANLSGDTIQWLTAVPPMGANCTPAQVHGILTIATALPEFKDSTQWGATAQKYLAGCLQDEAYPDGGFAETSFAYSIGTARTLLSCMNSLKVATELPVPEELLSRSEKWGEHFMYLARPDYLLPWTGHSVRIHAFDLVTQLARMHPHRQDFLYYATQGKEGWQPENPSRWFNWSGYCSMRDRYDSTANYLFFDVGPCGKNHKNANKLQIVVASHGRTLLEDRGNHTYSADSEFNTYFNYSYGHSTVLVDGKSQPLREEVSTAPLANPWTSTAVLDYNAGEYSGGYHSTSYVAGAVDNGVRHHRSVVFVKPDYWIVTDHLLPTGKDDPDRTRTFEQLFQYIPCEMSEGESLSVRSATPGEPNLALIPVSREGLELEIARGRRMPFILGWAVVDGNEPGGYVQKDTTASRRPFGERAVERAPTVIYRKRAAMPAVMQTVLWPMKAGQTQRPQVERLGGPGDGAVKVTLPDGRVDWYRSSSEPCEFELNGVSFHALAALVRKDAQGHVVAKEFVEP